MPEGIEVEFYRRTALKALNRRIDVIKNIDSNYLPKKYGSFDLKNLLEGNYFTEATRKGKLLLLSISNDFQIGLRFGMTGRLLVDGKSAIETLEYSSSRNEPEWDRFSIKFRDGGSLSIRDPRRLGAVEINPNPDALGVDLYEVTGTALTEILTNSTQPVKARLMNQTKISGLGNLLSDEILWRSSIDPRRPSHSLSRNDKRRLLHHIKRTVYELTDRGGSHMGNLQTHRTIGGLCPKDGELLDRYKIGGRTTYSCPKHQN